MITHLDPSPRGRGSERLAGQRCLGDGRGERRPLSGAPRRPQCGPRGLGPVRPAERGADGGLLPLAGPACVPGSTEGRGVPAPRSHGEGRAPGPGRAGPHAGKVGLGAGPLLGVAGILSPWGPQACAGGTRKPGVVWSGATGVHTRPLAVSAPVAVERAGCQRFPRPALVLGCHMAWDPPPASPLCCLRALAAAISARPSARRPPFPVLDHRAASSQPQTSRPIPVPSPTRPDPTHSWFRPRSACIIRLPAAAWPEGPRAPGSAHLIDERCSLWPKCPVTLLPPPSQG